ncbi:hypothetical protein EJB05_09092, partial [Eragrostis curvula]
MGEPGGGRAARRCERWAWTEIAITDDRVMSTILCAVKASPPTMNATSTLRRRCCDCRTTTCH